MAKSQRVLGIQTAIPFPSASGKTKFSVTQLPLYQKGMIKTPLPQMRKGWLWSAQMSRGWSLLSYPIPKALAKPGGCSGLWHKPGVGQGILQAGDFGASEDQSMFKFRLSKENKYKKPELFEPWRNVRAQP